MEYREFAKYYDIFYQKKDYKNEVYFLTNFIDKKDKVIDVGCGTGIHGSLLEKNGISVDGLDLNQEMLNIAKTRMNGILYNQNVLNINIDKKYDVVISMFAVMNHLNNTDELTKALLNLKGILNENGKIIIDLHNPQNSGEKTDCFDNITRTMIWNYDSANKIERSRIIFEINGCKYEDSHVFKIFTIDDVKKCCNDAGLKLISVYENYDINKNGKATSKNLQFLIKTEL